MRYPLTAFPIHKRSADKYYHDHDRWVERKMPELEREWHRPFDDIPAHIRIHWKDRWYWPPWYFNDVVGFLRVGSDGKEALAGDVYLKRRYFKRNAPERLYPEGEQAAEREQLLYLGSTGLHPVVADDNLSYLAAMRKIVPEARKIVREFGSGVGQARIALPHYDLDCVDFASADRQLRERGSSAE